MKIKSRSLLTVILAVLCAAAVALGIGFVLPKTETKTAQASGSSGDVKIVDYKAYYGNSSNPITSFSQLSTNSPYNTSVNKNDTAITFMMNSNSLTCKAVYYEFKVGVTVPAWEEWEISYNINFVCRATCVVSGYNASSGLYYFLPNPNQNTYDSNYNNSTFTDLSAMPISKDNSPATSNSQYNCFGDFKQSGNYSFSANIASGYGTPSSTLTLTNDSDNPKQFTFSYAAGFVGGSAGANRLNQLDVSLTGQTQRSKELYVTAPGDVELDYTGNDLKTDAEALIDNTSWYKRTDANDDYNHTAGEWASYTMPTTGVINVIKNGNILGGYELTYSLTDPTNHPFKLSDGTFTTQAQKFKIKVKPVDPPDLTSYLSVNAAGTNLVAGQLLSTVTIGWDTNANVPTALSSGTVAWYSSTDTLQTGTNTYRYKFTSNSNNYNSKDNLQYTLTVGAAVFDSIDVTYTQGNNKIFPSITLTDGTSLPGTLSVAKKDNGGGSMGSAPLNQCSLSVTPGTTLTGGSQGSIRVTYTENGKTVYKDIQVNVSVPQLLSISASQKPATAITESTTMAQLAQMLEVKAYYEDAPTTGKTLPFSAYTVTGTLVVSSSCPVNVEVNDAGDNAVANWQNANSGKCTTTVSVDAANLVSISAQWLNGTQPAPVYDRTPLNDLKPYLEVKAVYDDGGSKTLADADYVLKGNLTNVADGGSAVLTAEYGGKNAQVQLDNITKAQLEYVKVTFFDNTQKVKDTDDADVIRDNGMIIVKAKYAQFTDEIIVTSDCTFTGNLVASTTTKSVIHIHFDNQEVDYDTYLENGGLGVWVEAGNVTLLNKPTANTVLTYNGSEQTLLITNLDTTYMNIVGSVKQTTVGTYTVTISLIDPANYRWDDRTKDDIVINWEIKQLVLNPSLSDQAYSGNEFALKDILNLTNSDWNFITASGDIKKTDVGAYSATLTIKPEHFGNVVWSTSSITPTKKPVKLALTAVSASADCTINWKITPAVIAATWDDSKTIPVLNLTSASVANVPADLIVYTFTDVETGKTVSSNKLEKGHDYVVTASINTNDPRANNYAFTAPQPYELSIAAAQPSFAQKVANFMTQTAAGLPIWAWFLIALAALILLIVIIVVAVKRRKTKEEREEIKARKEEEKARKEEERQRREEERRLQQERLEEERRLQREKLEAEREMARAKQEAELEKIRAQAQAGMAGAGVATMAMAQPQQQPVQQVQTVDNEFLKEMREQMAELRADNKATQEKLAAIQTQQAPMAQAMPAPMMPQYQQMPMQQYPMYQQPMQMPMMPQYGDPTLARLEAQLNAMQAEQRARYDAEQRIELAAMRAEQHVDRDSRHSVDLAAMREHINGHNYNRIPDYSNATANQQPNSIEALGAIVAAALKNMANGEVAATQVPELPQKAEQEPVAKYPSDAVITTTTTVDTTKNGAIRRSRDEEESFDIDGFYDPLD